MKRIFFLLLLVITQPAFSQETFLLTNSKTGKTKTIKPKRLINVSSQGKQWKVKKTGLKGDSLIITSAYVTDTIIETYPYDGGIDTLERWVFRDTTLYFPLSALDSIQYARVKNRDRKLDQFGGFGLGYSLALGTIFCGIGAVVSFISGEPGDGFVILGISATCAGLFALTVRRLTPEKYDLKGDWKATK